MTARSIARRLFAAELITRGGDAVTMVAYPLTAILLLDASPADLALVGAAQGVAILLVSLPSGSWVDALRLRWPVMVAADLLRGALLVSVPLAAWLGLLSMPLLIGVAFLASAVGSLFDVAFAAWVPRLVGGDALHTTNARLELARSGSLMSGPALGGWLAGLLGPASALLADAASFVASAGLVFSLRGREVAVATPSRGLAIGSLVDGLRFVIGQRVVRAILATATINNLSRSIAMSIAILYLSREARLDPGGIGLAFGLGNSGFLAGALLSRRLSTRLGLGRGMQASVSLFAPSMALFALAPLELAGVAFTIMVFAHGLGIASHGPAQVTLRQILTPDDLRARVAAVTRITIFAAVPIGAVCGGLMAEAFGLRAALLVSAAGLALGSLPYLLARIGRIVTFDDAGGTAEPRIADGVPEAPAPSAAT